jgi:uncharacterized repeat protein (TIGR01451 family)
MSFVDAFPVPESVSGRVIQWSGVGPLAVGEIMNITVWAHVDGGVVGMLNNTVVVTGWPPYGDSVNDTGWVTVTGLQPGIMVVKGADPVIGGPSTVVTFTVGVHNVGDCVLDPVVVEDVLPVGMSFVDAFPVPESVSGRVIQWSGMGPLPIDGMINITLRATIDNDATGILNNTVTVTGSPPHGINLTVRDNSLVTVDREPPITIKEYGSPNIPVHRGPELLHYITSETLIYINASDTGIGVQETWYQIFYPNGTLYTLPDPTRDNYTLYTTPFTLTGPEGMYTIFYKSLDHLGNIERQHKQRAILDNTTPLGQ